MLHTTAGSKRGHADTEELLAKKSRGPDDGITPINGNSQSQFKRNQLADYIEENATWNSSSEDGSSENEGGGTVSNDDCPPTPSDDGQEKTAVVDWNGSLKAPSRNLQQEECSNDINRGIQKIEAVEEKGPIVQSKALERSKAVGENETLRASQASAEDKGFTFFNTVEENETANEASIENDVFDENEMFSENETRNEICAENKSGAGNEICIEDEMKTATTGFHESSEEEDPDEAKERRQLEDAQKFTRVQPARVAQNGRAFQRRSNTLDLQGSVQETESGTSVIGIEFPSSMFACASLFMLTTPGAHLIYETKRKPFSAVMCGIPLFLPSNEERQLYVSLQELPVFLNFFYGKRTSLEIDTRFFLALGPFVLNQIFLNQPLNFSPDFIDKVKRRIGSGLNFPPKTKAIYPQLYSVVHGFKRILRKKNKGSCTAKGCTDGKSIDHVLDGIGLPMCTGCCGITYRKSIQALLQTTTIVPWIVKILTKLNLPGIMNVILGSALLRETPKKTNFDELARYAERWVYRAPETCFGNPNIIGILWKLNLFGNFSVQESLNLGHQHWALQQVDSDIGETIAYTGCSCLIPKKGPLLSARKSFNKFPEDDTTEFFSSIIEERYGTDIRYMHVGALMSMVSVAVGLLKVVICGSPIGFEAFMGCDSKHVQEIDFRDPNPTFDKNHPIVLGNYGHMISFRALFNCALSDVATLVLVVDYPIMIHGFIHPKWHQPMGGCAHALHTMACISWSERLLGHRNPEIVNTGFVHQTDNELPTRLNESLEEACKMCILGTQAGVDYVKGNYPDFGQSISKLGIQPFLKDIGCSRSLVAKSMTISRKFSGNYKKRKDLMRQIFQFTIETDD